MRWWMWPAGGCAAWACCCLQYYAASARRWRMAKRKRASKDITQSSENSVVIDSSVVLAIGDELDGIEDVLEMVPTLTLLANIVTGSKPDWHGMFHDEFAESIREKLRLDINAKADESAEADESA